VKLRVGKLCAVESRISVNWLSVS